MSTRSILVVALFGIAVFVAVPMFLRGMFETWRAKEVAAPRVVLRTEPPPPSPPAPSPPATPPPPPVPAEPPPMRAVDEAAFGLVERPLAQAVVVDATPGRSFRIQLTSGAAGGQAETIEIDLDRDGKFDERWTVGSPPLRDVSPKDDGVYTEHTTWTDVGWGPRTGP